MSENTWPCRTLFSTRRCLKILDCFQSVSILTKRFDFSKFETWWPIYSWRQWSIDIRKKRSKCLGLWQWSIDIIYFLARYAFQAAIHTLWRERNARKHGEAPSSQGTIIKFIDKAVRNRLMSLRRDHHARALRGAYQTWIGAVQA